MNGRGLLETLTITLAAIATSLVVFGAFMVLFAHVHPHRAVLLDVSRRLRQPRSRGKTR